MAGTWNQNPGFGWEPGRPGATPARADGPVPDDQLSPTVPIPDFSGSQSEPLSPTIPLPRLSVSQSDVSQTLPLPTPTTPQPPSPVALFGSAAASPAASVSPPVSPSADQPRHPGYGVSAPLPGASSVPGSGAAPANPYPGQGFQPSAQAAAVPPSGQPASGLGREPQSGGAPDFLPQGVTYQPPNAASQPYAAGQPYSSSQPYAAGQLLPTAPPMPSAATAYLGSGSPPPYPPNLGQPAWTGQPPTGYYQSGGYPPASNPAYPLADQTYPQAGWNSWSPPTAASTAPTTSHKIRNIILVVLAVVVVAGSYSLISSLFGSSSSTDPWPSTTPPVILPSVPSEQPWPSDPPAWPTIDPLPSDLPSLPSEQPTYWAPTAAGQAAIGEIVTLEGISGRVDITITGPAETTNQVSFIQPGDGMVYIMVPAQVTYDGTSDFYIFNDDTVIMVTPDGAAHFTDPLGMFFLPDGQVNPLGLPQIDPGATVSGAFVYELAETDVAGSNLMIGYNAENPVTIDVGL